MPDQPRAYGLNGVETAVPDRHAGHGEGADEAAFHVHEEPPADDHRHEAGDHRRHGQNLPVAFVDWRNEPGKDEGEDVWTKEMANSKAGQREARCIWDQGADRDTPVSIRISS